MSEKINQEVSKKVSSSEGQTQMKNYILGMVIGILSCSGGVLFIIGSIVYMPQISSNFNPNLGGILFIAGSSFFFICDLLAAVAQPIFSPFRPLNNIGSLRAFLIMLGNISFIVGSVYFLASMPATVGVDIFVIASIFIWIPQVMACIGLYVCTKFTAPFYYQLLYHRKIIVNINMLLGIACLFFFVGSILFQDENSETIGLYQQGVVMFIVGSLFFFVAAAVGVQLRRNLKMDPLLDHRQKLKDMFYLSEKNKSLVGKSNSIKRKEPHWEAMGF